MSKTETELLRRLREADATDLERRFLDAAGREQPPPELSERMARAIGVSLPTVGSTGGGEATTGAAAPKAAPVASSLLPWVSGAVVAAVMAGAFFATRPHATPSAAPSSFASAVWSVSDAPSAIAGPRPEPPAATPRADTPPTAEVQATSSVPAPPASQRGRGSTTAGDLGNQIALVDNARSALASGGAERALTLVREYQAAYPTGTFRPEVSAIKIEALVKLGRAAEARSLAQRFLAANGPSPLADRVARLTGLTQP